MRTIANLNGVEFLRAINRTRHAVEKLMTVTDVLKIWKKNPTFTGKETAEERHEMQRKQIKQNLNDMLDTLLEKHPEETYACIMAMCVRDEGEPEPDGIEMVMAAFNLISDKRVLDFLLQLGKSGLIATEA
jgi:peroxiredoxin family protein